MSDPTDQVKPWTIKGIPPEDRNAAIAAADREGQTIGEWIRRAIRQTILADRRADRAPAPLPPAPGALAGEGNSSVGQSDPKVNLDAIERLSAVVKEATEATGEPPPKVVSRMLYARVKEQLQAMQAQNKSDARPTKKESD